MKTITQHRLRLIYVPLPDGDAMPVYLERKCRCLRWEGEFQACPLCRDRGVVPTADGQAILDFIAAYAPGVQGAAGCTHEGRSR